EPLHKTFATTKRSGCLAYSGLISFRDFRSFAYNFDSTATATVGCFNCQWQAKLVGEINNLLGRFHRICCPWGKRCPDLLSEVPGCDLITQGMNGRRRWANPDNAGIDYRLCKVSIFCQKTIARVDGVGSGVFSRLEHLVHRYGCVGNGVAVQSKCMIGQSYMH